MGMGEWVNGRMGEWVYMGVWNLATLLSGSIGIRSHRKFCNLVHQLVHIFYHKLASKNSLHVMCT